MYINIYILSVRSAQALNQSFENSKKRFNFTLFSSSKLGQNFFHHHFYGTAVLHFAWWLIKTIHVIQSIICSFSTKFHSFPLTFSIFVTLLKIWLRHNYFRVSNTFCKCYKLWPSQVHCEDSNKLKVSAYCKEWQSGWIFPNFKKDLKNTDKTRIVVSQWSRKGHNFLLKRAENSVLKVIRLNDFRQILKKLGELKNAYAQTQWGSHYFQEMALLINFRGGGGTILASSANITQLAWST